ncbi:MAG: hypothetical protein U1E62_22445 [Alsobacter sp.]
MKADQPGGRPWVEADPMGRIGTLFPVRWGVLAGGLGLAACLCLALWGGDVLGREGKQGSSGDDLTQRVQDVLARSIAKPFPSPACRAPADPKDPCDLGKLNLVLSLFAVAHGDRDVAAANAVLGEVLDVLGQRLVAGAGSRIDPNGFYFLRAALLYRLVRLHGTAPEATGRIDSSQEQRLIALFRFWAADACTLQNASEARVWILEGSENHSLQQDGTCWAAADLWVRYPGGANVGYRDGSTPTQQLLAWSRFLSAVWRERLLRGLFVEYFSPTYFQYTLSVVYLCADFADDEDLRRRSRSLIDLWWAVWAQEQVSGIHGGAKARAYPERSLEPGPMAALAWLYFAQSSWSGAGLAPGIKGMVLSPYRPPAAVAALAHRSGSLAPYKVAFLAPGRLRHAPSRVAASSEDGETYDIDPADGVLREAAVFPTAMLGTTDAGDSPGALWAKISSQNRWSGIVLGEAGEGRISIQADASDGSRSSYNATSGRLSGACLLVTRLPPSLSQHAGPLRVRWSGITRLVDQQGWIIVTAGRGMAAMRPSGPPRWSPDGASFAVDGNSAWLIVRIKADPNQSLADFLAALDQAQAGEACPRQPAPLPSRNSSKGLAQGWIVDSPFLSWDPSRLVYRLTVSGISSEIDAR